MNQAGIETVIVSSAEDNVDLPGSRWSSRRFVIETTGTPIDENMPSAFLDELIDALEVQFDEESAYVGNGGFLLSQPPLGRFYGVRADRAGSVVQIYFHFVRQSGNRATVLYEACEYPR